MVEMVQINFLLIFCLFVYSVTPFALPLHCAISTSLSYWLYMALETLTQVWLIHHLLQHIIRLPHCTREGELKGRHTVTQPYKNEGRRTCILSHSTYNQKIKCYAFLWWMGYHKKLPCYLDVTDQKSSQQTQENAGEDKLICVLDYSFLHHPPHFSNAVFIPKAIKTLNTGIKQSEHWIDFFLPIPIKHQQTFASSLLCFKLSSGKANSWFLKEKECLLFFQYLPGLLKAGAQGHLWIRVIHWFWKAIKLLTRKQL